MTTADRTLAALVLALVVAAPFVRPVWHAVDPRPSELLRAHLSIKAREAVDPWGQPWIRTLLGRGDPYDLFEVGSAGPDTRVGTPDDIPICVEGRSEDGQYRIVGVGPSSPTARPAWSYRSSPAVPVAIALILLLTRWISGRSELLPDLASRAIVACTLASLPTVLVWLVLGFNGAELIESRPFAGLISPGAAEIGSIYLLFAAAIFGHRDLHHLQKIEAQERGDGATA